MVKKAAIFTFIVTGILIFASSLIAFESVQEQIDLVEKVNKTSTSLKLLESLLSTVKDAETSQRGYLLTGEKIYLEPYEGTFDRAKEILKELALNLPSDKFHKTKLNELDEFIEKKFVEIRQTIELNPKDPISALKIVNNDSGRVLMDQIRIIVEELKMKQEMSFKKRSKATELKANQTIQSYLLVALIAWAVIAILKAFALIQIDRLNKFSKNIEALNRDLKNQNEMLEQYSWVAAHDLKEPVRVICTYSNLVKTEYQDKVDEDGVLMLDTINKSAQDALNKIDAILRFSTVGSAQLQYSKFELSSLISEVLGNLKIKTTENQAKITVEGSCEVKADKDLINIVFQNLIENSLKFKDEDSPLINIKIQNEGPDQVMIEIRDNGCGLKDVDPDKVFGIFKRLRNDKPGVGLGLSTVKKIVTLHRGEIWFDKNRDDGATFFIKLPIDLAENTSTG